MNLHEFKKKFIERMHFDSQKHDFSFGQKNADHTIFIYENCMICIFHQRKHNLEAKIFYHFLGCKLALVLKYKFLRKNNFACKV